MREMYENETLIERVLLIGVSAGNEELKDTEDSLDELKELADTAGAVTVGRIIQNRESIHPVTYIGKGKILEVREMAAALNATGVICDDELSPVQLRELENALDTKVMDRTMIILDIFANHAVTAEGKLQVELAQLEYRQARLTGLGRSLSRLGGGIGTRGPGEKKLEMDRRLIRERIGALKREIKDVRRHREVTRENRSKKGLPTAAIVGYTNAGKSTLLNALTHAEILSADMLFATLDTTTRGLILPGGAQILLTDTVGFINKLPHHLVDAFRSTLEEAKYADYLIIVADAADPLAQKKLEVVYDTLRELDVKGKKTMTLFNKQDLCPDKGNIRDSRADVCIPISARTGEGLDRIPAVLEEWMREEKILVERIFTYKDTSLVHLIRREGELLSESYEEDGIHVKAYVPMNIYHKI